ncbi:MAG: iron ABC transporter permease [bacterium]|nr:iron ABC transporter permease [bacterium]MDT8396236.1 iron ABC transporter permease [bacterium]
MKAGRVTLVLGMLAAATILVLGMAPFVGMTPISPFDILGGGAAPGKEYDIFWKIRLPRVLAAWLTGAGLAVAGMAFQALFRNPLATPFTLGVASGAALGAAMAIRFGVAVTLLGISGISMAALAGAALSVLLVYGISRALTRSGAMLTTATLLLAGVAVNFFFSSLNLFIQYISDFTHTFRIIRWLMGGLEVAGFRSVFQMIPFVALGTILILISWRELDLLTTGEEMAASRGVSVARMQRRLFFATSLLVGGVVAVCGPIGFVGIMVPHICRLMVGPGHRALIPATILFGGVFLTVCDTFARTVIAPAEIPVGVITALLGGPFFLALLIRDK